MPEALQDLAWIDAVALLLVLVLGVAGAVKGAIRFIVGLLTVVAGILLAGRYGADLQAETWPVISSLDDPERVGVLVGCASIFVGTLLVGALVARLLRKAAEETDLGGIDRLLGLLFGALRGALIAAVATIAIMAFGIEPLRSDALPSYTLHFTKKAAEASRGWTPPKIEEWLDDALELEPAEDA